MACDLRRRESDDGNDDDGIVGWESFGVGRSCNFVYGGRPFGSFNLTVLHKEHYVCVC